MIKEVSTCMKKNFLFSLLFFTLSLCSAEDLKGLWGRKSNGNRNWEEFIMFNDNQYFNYSYNMGVIKNDYGTFSINQNNNCLVFKSRKTDSYSYDFQIKNNGEELYFENGDVGWSFYKITNDIPKENITYNDFYSFIQKYRTYGLTITEINKDKENFDGYWLCEVTENLRIRESDSLNSRVLFTIQKGSTVFTYETGQTATIDGIESQWVYIWTIDSYDRDGNEIPRETKGWCFGGYLQKLRHYLPQ